MYVNEIMASDVKSCTAQANLEEISRLMWDNDCGAVPIVDQKHKPIGIVTDRDIAMSAMLNHQPLWDIKAQTLIQGQKLKTCEQDDSVDECLQTMQEYGIRRLPVVDAKGKLTGIVSLGDTLAFASTKAGKSQQKAIPVQKLIGMLQQVSGHHAGHKQPVAAAR